METFNTKRFRPVLEDSILVGAVNVIVSTLLYSSESESNKEGVDNKEAITLLYWYGINTI